MKHTLLTLAAAGLATASPLAARQATAPASPGGGGLAGLLGGALPGVASASAGNAAGLLGYCIKNNVLGGNGAASVLGRLTGQPGVTASPEFRAGQQGQLQTGDSTLSLAGVKDRVKTQMCSLVLKRAQSFL